MDFLVFKEERILKNILVQIINYKTDRLIEKCINSLRGIEKNIDILLISNSNLAFETKRQLAAFNNLKVFENQINLGFARANNLGFEKFKRNYVLLLNPDIIITPFFIDELAKSMERDSSIGMVCGKLLRCTNEGQPTNIIDSTGLMILKNRKVVDRGQGEEDIDQYDEPGYVFGCSGAAVLVRREMLEDIKINDEYFDDDFFAYKEDVDLSWRAQLNGWKAYYNPKAVAYHGRGWKISGRKDMPKFIRIHSLKNRYLTLIKNDNWANFIRDLPYIFWYDFKVMGYLLLREPATLKAYWDFLKLLPKALKKRKIIMSKKKVSATDIRKWFK